MILKTLLYIYQLEQYDKKRFLSFVYTNPRWPAVRKRSTLDWTWRIGLIFSVCVALVLLIAMIIYFLSLQVLYVALFFLMSVIFLPVFVVIADTLIAPLVIFRKHNIILLAKGAVRDAKKRGLITVGITGSFGKTSAKHIAVSVLGEKYAVLTLPGNVNTDIGVANYLLQHREAVLESEVLIVEMGAYRKGDIKKLCAIVEPDYSITTAIGECHLERFGSFANIVSAKFELANATRKKAFLNMDDTHIRMRAPSAVANAATIVSVRGSETMREVRPLDDFAGVSFVYQGETFTTKIVAEHITGLAALVFALSEELGLTVSEMQRGFGKLDYMPHRLEIIRNTDTDRVIIDDSYNGNYDGFLAGLSVLCRAKGRKVVLTPGIVELGEERSEQIQEELAREYAENVDLLLLVKNRNTEYIVKALRTIGYNAYTVYDTVQDAHNDLVRVLRAGDTILFQNDIPDNYV